MTKESLGLYLIKLILTVSFIIVGGSWLGTVAYSLTHPEFAVNFGQIINPTIVGIKTINHISIAEAQSIYNSETGEIIFTMNDANKYLKNSGYAYDPDTFQDTNAKYAGDCFLNTALSNNKDRIVFSTGCLPGDLQQAWVGVYIFPKDNQSAVPGTVRYIQKAEIKFLAGGSGRNFIWSADDKTITYEADFRLEFTENRTIDSATGEILKKEANDTIVPTPIETKEIPYEIIKDIANDNNACRDKKTITVNDYYIEAETVDLNRDKVSEFIIDAKSICEESLTGGNYPENHAIYIYQKINGIWTKIFIGGGDGAGVLNTKTDDYNDIGFGALLNHVLITTSNNLYSWNKSKLTYEEVSSIIESADEATDRHNEYIENWNSYSDYKHNFEISYPIGIGATRSDIDKYKITINLGSSDNPSSISISIIPEETLNAASVSYCGAYLNDKMRCEPITIEGINYIIEKSGKSESVMIAFPGGGTVLFVLDSATTETKSIFRKILSTFKFIEPEE